MKDLPLTVVFGSVAIVFGVSLYVFALYDLGNRSERMNEYEVAIQNAEQENKRLLSIASLAEQTLSDRSKIEGYVLPQEGVADLLKTIEGFAVATKGTISIVSVVEKTLPQDTNAAFKGEDLSITFTGDFSEVYHMLHMLEALPYPVTLSQVRLEVRKDGKKTSWNASVMMHVLKEK